MSEPVATPVSTVVETACPAPVACKSFTMPTWIFLILSLLLLGALIYFIYDWNKKSKALKAATDAAAVAAAGGAAAGAAGSTNCPECPTVPAAVVYTKHANSDLAGVGDMTCAGSLSTTLCQFNGFSVDQAKIMCSMVIPGCKSFAAVANGEMYFKNATTPVTAKTGSPAVDVYTAP